MDGHGHIIVVGAGFSGAVHARSLAEAGYRVTVVDRRPHIGGNAFDHVDENGIRVHAYGPHLFHTKNMRVLAWLRRFGTFVPYTHKVRAALADGRHVPLPVNLDTINAVHGTAFDTGAEVEAYLAAIAVPIPEPANAAEYLYSKIGRELTDLFFRPYTKKMWAFDLEDMAAAVVRRIPLRTTRLGTYFDEDHTQVMPRDGYTAVFENILDHRGIEVVLGTPFEASMRRGALHVFNGMPIDEWFGFSDGELPYRSIRFHTREGDAAPGQDWCVTNFTDTGPFTRETFWHQIPHHVVRETGRRTITREEPCDYRDNGMERYYPVKTSDGRYQVLYERYRERALADPTMSFIGRCGTYQYLDMDQVINQSLVSVDRWLEKAGGFASGPHQSQRLRTASRAGGFDPPHPISTPS